MKEVEVFKKGFEKPIKGFPWFTANGTYKKNDIDKSKKFILMSRHGYDL